jgi:hypothetical protein
VTAWWRRAPLPLAVALVAAGALLGLSPAGHKAAQPRGGRLTLAAAWPHAQQARIPGALPDGPLFQPLYFLDARTAVGTAPTPDGRFQRLLIRNADGTTRELRRLNTERNELVSVVTAAGGELAWAESTGSHATRLWAVNLRTGAAPRLLTANAGDPVFFDSDYDMIIADGGVHWAVATGSDTEIRSVPLAGGAVTVRRERGAWALTAWPWLVTNVAEQAGPTTLRNLGTGRDVQVRGSGPELVTCSPTWCRVTVVTPAGSLLRIDLMHPDGTARQRVGGSQATSAIADIAPLDRFVVLAEPDPNSDLTGTQHLLAYDVATTSTVDIADGVNAATYRGGVLWWSTGDEDAVWHTVDLRTA